MITGILFCTRGTGRGFTLDARMAGAAGFARHRARVGAVIGAHQRLARRPARHQRLHRHARRLYLGARPRRRDLGRALGLGSARRACASWHRDVRWHSAARLDRDPLLRRLHLHHDEDAVRPAPHHDRRQCRRHVPRRHPGRPAGDHHLHPLRRACRACRLAARLRTAGATANLGIGMLFQAFAAVVIGGVSLKGGIGQLPGVFAGVLLLSRSRPRSMSWACRRTTRR